MDFPADQPLPEGWVGERKLNGDWEYRYAPDYAAWLDEVFELFGPRFAAEVPDIHGIRR